MAFMVGGRPRFSSSGVMILAGKPAMWHRNSASLALPSCEPWYSLVRVGVVAGNHGPRNRLFVDVQDANLWL